MGGPNHPNAQENKQAAGRPVDQSVDAGSFNQPSSNYRCRNAIRRKNNHSKDHKQGCEEKQLKVGNIHNDIYATLGLTLDGLCESSESCQAFFQQVYVGSIGDPDPFVKISV